jgi:hypothetical protein
MDILAKTRKLETQLARTVDRAASRMLPVREREPLEIVHAVLDSIDREVQPAGRGRHLFPFNRMRVSVLAPSGQAQARIEAVFASEPTLEHRIATRLEAAGCPVADLEVTVACVEARGDDWTAPDVHVEFERAVADVAVEPVRTVEPPSIEFAVVAGTGEQPAYVLRLQRIAIGRCAEVRDPRNRLLRTNHVAFADDATRPNQTVSRRHAHVEFLPEPGEFRVYDDGSEQGTSVARSGRSIAVPPGARGVRLQPGDEILLGQARLRVSFDRESA